MEKIKNKNLEELESKYYEIWSTMIDLEMELLEGDREKEKILIEQMLKATHDKLEKYK